MTGRPGPEHDRWADSLGAYLLDALPAGERAGFEAHLAQCAACRADEELLTVARDALPASPAQLDPPPELKDRIMRVVNAEAELLRAAGPEADRPPAPAAAERRRFAWWPFRPALAVAATFALLLAGGVTGVLLRGGDGGGGDTRTLQAQVAAPDATAQLQIDGGRTRLVARRLPAPPSGRVYQVWLKRPGQDPEPTDALFRTRRDGSASVDVPGSVDGVEAVLVTDEPDGGSPAPTRKPIIVASLS